MWKAYIRATCQRAWCSTVHHLVDETVARRAAVVILAIAALLVPYAYVTWFNRTGSEFSDALKTSGLALGVYLTAGVAWFFVYAVFIAPYLMWKEERERADQAEIIAIPTTEAARIVAECTMDGVVDLERLRAEMDRITDPMREYKEAWEDGRKEERKALIARGRDMVQRFLNGPRSEHFHNAIKQERAYLDLRPHLRQEYFDWVRSVQRTVFVGDGRPYETEAAKLLDEIDHLEKKWGLI